MVKKEKTVMQHYKLKIILYFLSISFIVHNQALAQYKINHSVFGNGIGNVNSSTHTVNTIIGQTGIGLSNNASHQCHLGFWYSIVVFVPIVEEFENQLPIKYELFQNYPNPFNPVTVIRYSIPVPSKVQIEVFNIRGEKIVTLVNTSKTPGFYEVNFDATNLSSGFYFYYLKTKEFNEVKKMVITK
jgi:hypothetical protein